MQTICTSIQTDNHINTSSLNFYTGRVLFLTPNQQCQSTEGQEDCMSADHNHQILQMAQQGNKYPQFGKKLSYTVGGSVAEWLACWTQAQ